MLFSINKKNSPNQTHTGKIVRFVSRAKLVSLQASNRILQELSLNCLSKTQGTIIHPPYGAIYNPVFICNCSTTVIINWNSKFCQKTNSGFLANWEWFSTENRPNLCDKSPNIVRRDLKWIFKSQNLTNSMLNGEPDRGISFVFCKTMQCVCLLKVLKRQKQGTLALRVNLLLSGLLTDIRVLKIYFRIHICLYLDL